jgi:hypothetical protein
LAKFAERILGAILKVLSMTKVRFQKYGLNLLQQKQYFNPISAV